MSDQDSNPKQTGPSSPNWVCAEAACFAPNGEGDIFSNGDWMIYPSNGESGPVAAVSTKERMELIVEAVNFHAALAEGNAQLKKQAEEEERSCLQVIDERDHWEEVIEKLAESAGCKEEWSSSHEHGNCIHEALGNLETENAQLRKALLSVEGLFSDGSPFYIAKVGNRITNGDQDVIDKAFMLAKAALEQK